MIVVGAGSVVRKSQTLSKLNMWLTLTVLLLVWSLAVISGGNCSQSSQQGDTAACEHEYQQYLNVIDNFTHCELHYARPFRLCMTCADNFELAKSMFWNLTEEQKHIDCKVKYMQADRVQVIPTMQADIEDIWNKAHCQNCYLYEPDGLGAGQVVYRPDVVKFMELYENLTNCLNNTEDVYEPEGNIGNTSAKCRICNSSYAVLINHYNCMYSAQSADVCMDLVDRMNYTRTLWTLHLKCTHREGDHDLLPVVAISCVVACTPILFYVSLRVTSKVGRKKIFKQKRLGASSGTTNDSGDHSQGAGGDTAASKRRHTTAD